jgi:WD40 repeat protein
LVLVGHIDGEARLYRSGDDGPPIAKFRHGSGFPLRCVAISADTRLVLTGDEDGLARIWEVSGRQVCTMPHETSVAAACFSRDHTRVAIAYNDGRIILWNTTGNKLGELGPAHVLKVRGLAFTPDDRFLLSAGTDKTLRIWSMATSAEVGTPLLHGGAVCGVAVSADGRRILTTAEDRTTRLWSIPALDGTNLELPAGGWTRTLTFSPDDSVLLAAGETVDKSGFAAIYDKQSDRPRGVSIRHTKIVPSAAISADSGTVATGGSDRSVRLFDLASGHAGPELRHPKGVLAVTLSPGGDLVLSGCDDGCARLWDTRTGKLRGAALKLDGAVTATAFSRDGERFVTGTSEGQVAIWRTADSEPVFAPVHGQPVLTAEFSRDGSLLLICGLNEFRLLDVAQGGFVGPALSHNADVRAACFSADEQFILTAADDGTARIWDRHKQYECVARLQHKLLPVLVARFSPDGGLILTGATDGSARLWDPQTGKTVGPALRHGGHLVSAAFSHDGQRFATASTRGVTRLWTLPVPVQGTAAEVLREIEVASGVGFDDRGEPVVLGADEWLARRQALRK